MHHQYGENCAKRYIQTIIRSELMLNALHINQKNYTLSTFPSTNRRNFEDSRKVLAVSVSEFYKSFQGGEGLGEQHRGLRTKALMRDLGSRLDVDTVFVRTEKILWK